MEIHIRSVDFIRWILAIRHKQIISFEFVFPPMDKFKHVFINNTEDDEEADSEQAKKTRYMRQKCCLKLKNIQCKSCIARPRTP